MAARDLLRDVLASLDFRTVDEPLHSAVDLVQQLHAEQRVIPAFVWPIYERVKRTQELTPKRALWLCILTTVPAVAAYVVQTSPDPERAKAFIEWLVLEFEKLFHGEYAAHASQLDVFVATCLLQYDAA